MLQLTQCFDRTEIVMSERGGQGREQFSAEETSRAEHRRVYEIANREKSKLVFHGYTNAEQLDKFLGAELALHKWIAHHPSIKDKATQSEFHAEEALKLTKVLTGSYYTEKARFCQEQADSLSNLAGESTDDLGIAARKEAASWLRTKASCLEMPTPRPPAPGQQEKPS
jgi:hypothetical protein